MALRAARRINRRTGATAGSIPHTMVEERYREPANHDGTRVLLRLFADQDNQSVFASRRNICATAISLKSSDEMKNRNLTFSVIALDHSPPRL